MALVERHRRASHGRTVANLFTWLHLCATRRQERLFLAELDEHRLRDIGLSRADAEQEAARPPWDGRPR